MYPERIPVICEKEINASIMSNMCTKIKLCLYFFINGVISAMNEMMFLYLRWFKIIVFVFYL